MKRKLFSLLIICSLLTACSSDKFIQQSNEETTEHENKSYLDIELGKDYTDLSADITLLTSRTDLVTDTNASGEYPDYLKEFNDMYPGINVLVESATDYDFDVKNRLVSGSWGDICFIPGVENADLDNYFEPYFSITEGEEIYNAIDSKVRDGLVYGIPSSIDVQGIVYNKRVWEECGISELPKSTEDFITDLEIIKNNSNAIPLYTNYESGWALVNWDFNATGAAVGINNYINDVLFTTKRPFIEYSDGTGPYAAYKLLYDCVAEGLVEKDPHTSSWELCKGRINNGEIGCMVLGSWAISQMQSAGEHDEDISYMPFPISINGQQYALSSSNYCYGINKNIDDNKKLASMIFVKFLVDKSGYDFDNGSIPVLKTNPYPNTLDNFENVTLVSNTTISDEFENLSMSTVGINYDSKHLENIVDAALNNESFDDIMNDWNDKWETAITNKG